MGFGNNGLAKANLHGANDQKVLAGGDRESVGAGFTDSGITDELRILESFGLLAELYANQHGPEYRNGAKPNATRIVEDMLNAIPDDVTNMGERKLKSHVGDAIKAWERKKRR